MRCLMKGALGPNDAPLFELGADYKTVIILQKCELYISDLYTLLVCILYLSENFLHKTPWLK